MEFISLILGFILLVLGSNLLVEGSVKLAKRFKISVMIISMTIISIGTSIPELAISIVSSIQKNQIALSNNLGSVISAICISIGFTSLIYNIKVKKRMQTEINKPIIIDILLITMFLVFKKLTIFSGIIFLLLFVIYLIDLIKSSNKIISKKDEIDLVNEEIKMIEEADEIIKNSVITMAIFITLGIIAIIFGGNFVVDSATIIARNLKIQESIIGATIVAFGTTMPELSTAIVAARKKEYDVILGNVIGSGVSNILFIVGVALTIHPIEYTSSVMFQMVFSLILLFILKIIIQKGVISKKSGLFIFCLYIVYILFSIFVINNF